jgi:hypothetical protein
MLWSETPETDQIIAKNGAYVEFCKPLPTNEMAAWAYGKENADKLWALSEELVGEKFDY